ncbi:hypothetical protein QE152_g28437 [Popillia japonica]|uniref:Uncharacterized protein n=1 Tax=Popillia japonica TaxID=7064 RepID=A0AAW1JJP7_POPJA
MEKTMARIHCRCQRSKYCRDRRDEILNQDEEDVTPDDLLQSFSAAAYDVTEHTEHVTEITNLELPATVSLIDKAMDIFTDPDNDEGRSINLMIAVAKDVQCYKDLYTVRKIKAKHQTLRTKT